MKDNEMELLLRSFDEDLDDDARHKLARLLESSDEARLEHRRLERLRGLVSGSKATGFDGSFADRVMAAVRATPEASREQAGVHPGTEASREQAGVRSSPEASRDHAGVRPTPDASREQAGDAPASAERAPERETNRERSHTPHADRSASSRRRRTGVLDRSGSWRISVGVALAVTVVAVVGVAMWLLPKTVSVPFGGTKTVELADGSVVELGSGSTMTYRSFQGRDERRVALEGEAFFDVVRDERPFIVETFNATVSVLGTRFNVRAWADDPGAETSVALASGRVAVAPKAADLPSMQEVVVLEPGQETSIARDSAAVRIPTPALLDYATAWRTGGLAILDQPLDAVIPTIERRFNVQIRVTDPAIRNRPVAYLNPRPTSAEDVISDICHTLGLHYRHTANGFEILP